MAGQYRGGAAVKPWRIPYPKFGSGPGLARVAAIAARLGLDLAAFGGSAAVVVGSNGKGSTAAMTAALLRQVGGQVGLFTSPHLFDLNERFRIDEEDILDAELDHHWRRVSDAAAAHLAGKDEHLGGFEFLFLIAADWFAARKCRFSVWEAGIGGRLDPVRLIEARRIALTSLDLEHTALLGGTLEEIARDKLDAAPSGATAYVGASCAAQWNTIASHCGERGVRATLVDPLASAPLAGAHQHANAALAAALAGDMCGGGFDEESLRRGFAETRWPGRLEILGRDPLIVIDVGHTPAGVAAALEGFRAIAGEQSGVLVCGASIDKNVEAIVAPLAAAFPVIVCAAARHKGAPAALIARQAAQANPGAEIVIADDVREAYAAALARARASRSPVYAAGGLFLAAEFKAVHLGRDPATLAFF